MNAPLSESEKKAYALAEQYMKDYPCGSKGTTVHDDIAALAQLLLQVWYQAHFVQAFGEYSPELLDRIKHAGIDPHHLPYPFEVTYPPIETLHLGDKKDI